MDEANEVIAGMIAVQIISAVPVAKWILPIMNGISPPFALYSSPDVSWRPWTIPLINSKRREGRIDKLC